MSLTPVTIASYAGFSDFANLLGPFQDTTSGDIFVVLGSRTAGPAFAAEVWMSSDDGSTWAVQDNGNHQVCYAVATWASIAFFCSAFSTFCATCWRRPSCGSISRA